MGESFEEMAWAEMLWVDRLGVYMRAGEGWGRAGHAPYPTRAGQARQAAATATNGWPAGIASLPAVCFELHMS